MHDQLIATYRELMQALQQLPTDIAAAQERLASLKRDGQALAQAGEEAEHSFIARSGGWKALGSNDKERDLAVAAFRRESMRTHAAQLALNTAAADEAAQLVSMLERRYGAVCYQVRLHAALLQYLGQAGAPVPTQPSQVPAALGGNGHRGPSSDVSFYAANTTGVTAAGISVEDAALIGL